MTATGRGGRTPAPADPARTYAVIVCAERYRAGNGVLPDLPGLGGGGRRFAGWLERQGVPPENIVLLSTEAGTPGGATAPPSAGRRPDDESTSTAVEDLLTDRVPSWRGELLWVYWSGHGFIDPQGRTRLVLSNATDRNLRNLDMDSVLRLYQSSFLDGFARQRFVVDACRRDLSASDLAAGRYPEPMSLPSPGGPSRDRDQLAWLAASPGELAGYSAREAKSWFTDAFLETLEDTGTGLDSVPDYEALRTALVAKLEAEAPRDGWSRQPVLLRLRSGGDPVRTDELLAGDGMVDPFAPRDDGTGPAAVPELDAYLRWLTDTHRHLRSVIAGVPVRAPLAGLPALPMPVTDRSTQHTRLREVDYLSSDAVSGSLADHPLPTYLTATGHVDRHTAPAGVPVPPAELLGSVWRSVILGDPGGGKTTLARTLAFRQATTGLGERDAHWRLPVLCRAADLAALAMPGRRPEAASEPASAPPAVATPDHLITRAIRAGWNGSAPADPLSGDPVAPEALERLARQASGRGRLLLIVDGLDEVPTGDERTALVAALNGLVEDDGPRYDLPGRAPGNQLLVTSRLIGYYATPLDGGVQQFVLRPMDEDAVAATGRYWISHYCSATGRGTAGTRTLTGQLDRELGKVSATARDLAANPFLLTCFVSAVAAGRIAELGDDGLARSDLYDVIVDSALARVTLRTAGLDADRLLRTQAALAYEVHRTARTGILATDDLTRRMREALALTGPPDAPPVDRALAASASLGLLTARGQGLYGFLHLSIEEYLAGRWLVDTRWSDGPGRLGEHLGDPRWAEPIRLGLGHLSRTDPDRLDAVLTGLLGGDGSSRAAVLLCAAPRPIAGRALRPAHLRALVTALLGADPATVPEAAAALETVVRDQRWLLGDGQRASAVALDELAAAIASPDPARTASAARTAERLSLTDRPIVEALFRAQERDAEETGWAAVRALAALNEAHRRALPPPDPEKAAEVWGGLPEVVRQTLGGVRVEAPIPRPASEFRRAFLPSSLTPFLAALNESTAARIISDLRITRAVICLYGGVDAVDRERWAEEEGQLRTRLAASSYPPAVRHRAAVLLDTVVAPALARAADPRLLVPEFVTVDTPLTPRFTAWLTAGHPAETIADLLRDIAAAPDESADARGDALAARALMTGALDGSPQDSASGLPDPVLRRARWRLGRTALTLRGALGELAVGPLITAFERVLRQPGARDRFVSAVLRTAGVALASPASYGVEIDRDQVRTLLLLAVCAPPGPNKTFNLAVTLDTAGKTILGDGPASLAAAVATLHLAAESAGLRTWEWDLDPLAPRTADAVTEALTHLSRMAPRLGFARCWLLDRLTPLLAERGLLVEAACLAAEVLPVDRISAGRTLGRLLPLLRSVATGGAGIPRGDGELRKLLEKETAGIEDPYARARAHVALGALTGGDPVGLLSALLPTVGAPHERLRLMELAADRGPGSWTPDLRRAAIGCVMEIDDRHERSLACLRTARRCDPHEARALRDFALRHLPPEDPESTTLAASLLPYERELRALGLTVPASWAILTASAACADATDALRGAGAGRRLGTPALWRSLARPGTEGEERAGAVAELLRRGRAERLELDRDACEAVTELLRCDVAQEAAELLAVSVLSAHRPETGAWRTHPDPRVSGLATLLQLESGGLDPAAVEALPRLLSDPDDRVRLRTALAVSQVARGRGGTPVFRASRAGARTLADLALLYERCSAERPELTAELMWMMLDLVQDSLPVLTEALRLLGPNHDARGSLLGHLGQLTPEVHGELVALLPSLPDEDRRRLLGALLNIAYSPERAGLSAEEVAGAVPAVQDLLDDLDDGSLGRAIVLLGIAAPAGEDSVRRLLRILLAYEAVVGDPGEIARHACNGLGYLLLRCGRDGTEQDRAAAESARRELTRLAREADGGLAAEAVGALLRSGDDRVVASFEDPDEPGPEATTLLWGLGRAIDQFFVGPDFQRAIARTADFVTRPPGLSGADAVDHTDRLVRALAGRAELELAEESGPESRRRAGSRPGWTYSLNVLAEIGSRHPAGLRVLVGGDGGRFTGLLRSAAHAPGWTMRLAAVRLLVLLGRGDRATVGTLLTAAGDTEAVLSALFAELRWFDRIEPDGLTALVEAVRAPSIARAHLAVRMLAALVAHDVLDEEGNALALDALERAARRPDADRSVLSERDGALSDHGTFGDLCRQVLQRLLDQEERERPPDAGEQTGFVLYVPDERGAPARMWAAGGNSAPPAPFLEHQLRYLADVEGRVFADNTSYALTAAAAAAHAAGIPLHEVLTRAGEEG
ncbi:caspase family protein [Streptomyces sp. NPDC001822]|uniref:caspase family protein n=1 Tax=Streptomyces sp. NPDC001822 TaxID=3364614 RepID=UPI003697D3A8